MANNRRLMVIVYILCVKGEYEQCELQRWKIAKRFRRVEMKRSNECLFRLFRNSVSNKTTMKRDHVFHSKNYPLYYGHWLDDTRRKTPLAVWRKRKPTNSTSRLCDNIPVKYNCYCILPHFVVTIKLYRNTVCEIWHSNIEWRLRKS